MDTEGVTVVGPKDVGTEEEEGVGGETSGASGVRTRVERPIRDTRPRRT